MKIQDFESVGLALPSSRVNVRRTDSQPHTVAIVVPTDIQDVPDRTPERDAAIIGWRLRARGVATLRNAGARLACGVLHGVADGDGEGVVHDLPNSGGGGARGHLLQLQEVAPHELLVAAVAVALANLGEHAVRGVHVAGRLVQSDDVQAAHHLPLECEQNDLARARQRRLRRGRCAFGTRLAPRLVTVVVLADTATTELQRAGAQSP